MEKKIYIPSKDKLEEMQDIGVNMYNYLQAKVIELLTLEGVKYPSKGILKNSYKYFRENPEIAYAICRMYPEEIQYSEIAKNETTLCLELLTKKPKNDIYQMDNLSYFTEDTQKNGPIMQYVIYTLAHELQETPKYRFEYKPAKESENSLLDKIFSLDLKDYEIDRLGKETIKNLMNIEPAYFFKLDSKNFNENTSKEIELLKSTNKYLMRYGIKNRSGMGSDYQGKDILTNPDENTKKLIRHIEKNRDLIY